MHQAAERKAPWPMVLGLVPILLALLLPVRLLASFANATQTISVSTATNRLAFPGTQYDAGGNLTHLILGGETMEYVYDSANMMKSLSSSEDQARVFVYNAADERILTF